MVESNKPPWSPEPSKERMLPSVQGQSMEELAADYFLGQGYEVLARNYRAHGGELDLVVARGIDLVFVEVRFRSNVAFGSPEDTVDRRKMRKITKAALQFVLDTGLFERCMRFDVVSVRHTREGPRLEHLPDAFVPVLSGPDGCCTI